MVVATVSNTMNKSNDEEYNRLNQERCDLIQSTNSLGERSEWSPSSYCKYALDDRQRAKQRKKGTIDQEIWKIGPFPRV